MIRMCVDTSYNGLSYKKHEEYKAPDPQTEKRWIKNGIAEKADEISSLFEKSSPNTPTKEYLESLSDEELQDEANRQEIDISKARSRTAAIRLLLK